jgi:hypothetical protein
MPIKTGNRIRYRGLFRFYRNGNLAAETPCDLTAAFGSWPGIAVEDLQFMATKDIQARAEAFIASMDKCANFEVLNDQIQFGECVDRVRRVIGGSPAGSENRYALDWGGKRAIWVFYSIDGDNIITSVDELAFSYGGQQKSFEVFAHPAGMAWYVDTSNISPYAAVSVSSDTVTVTAASINSDTTRELYIRWGTPSNKGSIGKTINVTFTK